MARLLADTRVVRDASVRARVWPETAMVDVLAVVHTPDSQVLALYESAPLAGTDPLGAAAARILEHLHRRLNGAFFVQTRHGPSSMAASVVDADNAPLTSFALVAEERLNREVVVTVPDGRLPGGLEVRRGLAGFPDTERLVDWYAQHYAGSDSIRAVTPAGRTVHLRGADLDAFYAAGEAEALLRASLSARLAGQHGWRVGDIQMIGPGMFTATVACDVGTVTNSAAVPVHLGAARGAAVAAEWFHALLMTRIEPLAEPVETGGASYWLVACAALDRRWFLGGVAAEAEPDGQMCWVKGLTETMERDITIYPDASIPEEALWAAVLDGYRGPEQLRVVDPTGCAHLLPRAAAHVAPDDVIRRPHAEPERETPGFPWDQD